MVRLEVFQSCLLLPRRAPKMGVEGDRGCIGRVVQNKFDHQPMFGQERLERRHAKVNLKQTIGGEDRELALAQRGHQRAVEAGFGAFDMQGVFIARDVRGGNVGIFLLASEQIGAHFLETRPRKPRRRAHKRRRFEQPAHLIEIVHQLRGEFAQEALRPADLLGKVSRFEPPEQIPRDGSADAVIFRHGELIDLEPAEWHARDQILFDLVPDLFPACAATDNSESGGRQFEEWRPPDLARARPRHAIASRLEADEEAIRSKPLKHSADRRAADRQLLGQPMFVQERPRRQPPRLDIGPHGLIQHRRERELLSEIRFSEIHEAGPDGA